MANRVGILREAEHGGIVETSGKNRIPPIVIPYRELNGAPFGMTVVVELTSPEDSLNPRGRVLEVLGDPMRPDVAITAIIRDHGLRTDFPKGVLLAASRVPTELSEDKVLAEIAKGRRDLRTLRTITIDGKDAKDLDDAISIQEISDGGFRLWVHIADVTHYVKEGSSMDEEALERGNSVYLVDRVLPMLPPRLSNGICSLNPKVDRFTLTCMMEISSEGKIIDSDIFESVIRSDLRANYTDVFSALDSGEMIEEYRGVLAELRMMRLCASRLGKQRSVHGNLEFSFPETHVEMDSGGKPTAIYAYPINEANSIIEEFMIAANQTVAKTFTAKQAPFLYRVHELPDPEKLERFMNMARLLGIRVKFRGAVPTTRELALILEKVQASPYEAILSQLLLQSLAKARYSHEPLGHYGLGLDDYSHFTSPIRRYPDLFIHRVIKGYLRDDRHERRWRKIAPQVGEHCSDTERAAMYAEYDTIDLKVAEYMSERLGEHVEARVSGMIDAGLFVMLDSTVEGLIPFRTMNDYYHFDPDTLTATGQRGGRQFKLGDKLDVVIARADLIRRQVDFVLPEDWEFTKRKQQRESEQPGSGRAGKKREGQPGGKKPEKHWENVDYKSRLSDKRRKSTKKSKSQKNRKPRR